METTIRRTCPYCNGTKKSRTGLVPCMDCRGLGRVCYLCLKDRDSCQDEGRCTDSVCEDCGEIEPNCRCQSNRYPRGFYD